jgi:hypothetical protein
MIVEIFEHAVAMQQSAKLNRRRAFALRPTVNRNAASAICGDLLFHLVVKLSKRTVVLTEMTREMLKGLVAVKIVLALKHNNFVLLKVVNKDANWGIIWRLFRQRTPALIALIAIAATIATAIAARITTTAA